MYLRTSDRASIHCTYMIEYAYKYLQTPCTVLCTCTCTSTYMIACGLPAHVQKRRRCQPCTCSRICTCIRQVEKLLLNFFDCPYMYFEVTRWLQSQILGRSRVLYIFIIIICIMIIITSERHYSCYSWLHFTLTQFYANNYRIDRFLPNVGDLVRK